ncbi:MAG: glycoside hydrolase family 2 protein [Planctomycetota bacterium]
MQRRYRRHDRRNVTDLGGFWDFQFLGEVEFDEVDPARISFEEVMAIPGNFDATPGYPGARGMSAFGKTALVTDATPHRLILDGVHHAARVFVDGKQIAEHLGGFTQFAADFTPDGPGEVQIVVLVDNRIDYDRCPLHLDYFDWYHYGGLSRGVELHRLGELNINDVRVVTESIDPPTLRVEIEYQATSKPLSPELVITVDGEEKIRDTVTLDNRFGKIGRTIELPGAALWSPQEPNLHMVHVRLGEDDLRERTGIRTVEVNGRDVCINGQPQRLLGFNRHEAHPQFGHGLPSQLIVSDVQQLKEMNCNFVRGSHYPQDVRFLDLCDEMGLCVWNEGIGWQHTAEQLTDPKFVNAQKTNLGEMIAAAKNHPSVIMWGLINESHSNDADARKGYEALIAHIRQCDPTRPVTYACNRWEHDICMDLADIVAINIYPGWYGSDIEAVPAFIDKVVKRFKDEGFDDKPMMIAEIGAGALYGWRDDHETRWSEQYQSKLLTVVIEHMFETSDRFFGLTIWQFGDCRTSHQVGKAIGRPRAFNNKGVVDEYRRAKQAFTTVKNLYARLSGKS